MAGKKKGAVDAFETEAKGPADISGEKGVIYTPEAAEIEIIPGISASSKGDAGLSDHARELLFNEDFVEVMVHESTDENAENPVFTSCNGVPQYFLRGEVQTVRRKYLAILACCKEHNMKTPQYTAPDGSRAVGISRTSSLKYPFSVISDPNPRGAAWLKALLHSPT